MFSASTLFTSFVFAGAAATVFPVVESVANQQSAVTTMVAQAHQTRDPVKRDQLIEKAKYASKTACIEAVHMARMLGQKTKMSDCK